MSITPRFLFYVALIASKPVAGYVQAEETPPVKLKLHLMAEPTPAMTYRLLPPAPEQSSGNAAVPYGKVTAEETTFFGTNKAREKIYNWQEMPLDKLKQETVVLPETSIDFLEQGSRCKYCDWQLPIHERPFFTMNLPNAQETRHFSRILAVKARDEIAHGKFDQAVKTFQINYALGRNVGQGETLIHGLIGIAICGNVFEQILVYVQQPDAPNLYWALTALPTPLIDMRRSVETEAEALELSFPELRDLETANRTPDEWRALFTKFATTILDWNRSNDEPAVKPKTPDELNDLCKQFAPKARRELMAAGLPKEKVRLMTEHQLALIYSVRRYHQLFDDGAKYFSLPYPQAQTNIDAAVERAKSANTSREILPITLHSLRAPGLPRRDRSQRSPDRYTPNP